MRESVAMAVEFRCESCGKLLAADGDCRQVDCPRCNSASEVPASLAPAGHSQQPSEPLADPQQEQRSPALSTGFMSRVMPVMISLLFHVGLLVVVVFLGAMLTIGETEREIVVHGVRRSPNPGGSLTPSPRNTVSEAAVEKVSTTVRESALPSDSTPDRTMLMSAGGAAPSTWEARGPSTAEFYSSFFGSGSNAKHVVYVVDYTGSMYDVFDRVSFELANSIGQLDEKQTFHVILFHGSGKVIELENKRLIPASDAYKLKAAQFVTSNSQPFGKLATGLLPALSRAFDALSNVQGGPKVVYFLTDLTNLPDMKDIQTVVTSLNGQRKVILNTFLFSPSGINEARIQSASRDMTRLAEENSGEFRLITQDFQ
jgi:hypothetical protein